MSTNEPAEHTVYCLEAGLRADCWHDFAQGQPAPVVLPVTGGNEYVSVNFSYVQSFRLYCRRCGGIREWPLNAPLWPRKFPTPDSV